MFKVMFIYSQQPLYKFMKMFLTKPKQTPAISQFNNIIVTMATKVTNYEDDWRRSTDFFSFFCTSKTLKSTALNEH